MKPIVFIILGHPCFRLGGYERGNRLWTISKRMFGKESAPQMRM